MSIAKWMYFYWTCSKWLPFHLSFCIAITNYTNTYTYASVGITQRHNDDERHSLLEKYTSHFIWKGCVWEGVGDRTELQHIDPHSYGHQRFFSVLLGAGFLYCIFSPTRFIPNWLIEGLRAPSAECGLSLPHLVTNWSGLQTLNFRST